MSPGVRKQGLRRVPFDPRYYSHRHTFGSVVGTLPPTLGRVPVSIKDQGTTNYCTAFATSSAAEYHEKMLLSPEYSTAKEGEYQGSPIYGGTSPTVALETGRRYGFLPFEQSPLRFDKDGWITPARWQNYPPHLDGQAITHRQDSYYKVGASYDAIKNALFQAKDENSVVIMFGKWFQEFNEVDNTGIVKKPTSQYVTLHAYIFYDWMMCADGKERLKAQLSQGQNFGDRGTLYFDRDCITATFGNSIFSGTGAFIFRDDKGQNNQVVQAEIYYRLLDILGRLLALLKQR